jgi:hypothetical protein
VRANALECEGNGRKEIMIYHCAKVFHLPSILAYGLRRSELSLTPGEKPILWFSTNPTWENTVLPFGVLSLKEAHFPRSTKVALLGLSAMSPSHLTVERTERDRTHSIKDCDGPLLFCYLTRFTPRRVEGHT